MKFFENNKRYFAYHDHMLLGIAVLLTIFGVYLQFNIATSLGNTNQMGLFVNQLRSLVVAVGVFVVLLSIPNLSSFLYKYSFIFISLAIILLTSVLFMGDTYQGGTRWLKIFFFRFQPSELVHPIIIIFFAKYFDKRKNEIKKTGILLFVKKFLPLIIVSVLCIVLIYLEKHLSTLVVLCLTMLAMLFIAEFKIRLILMLILLLFSSFTIAIKTQKHRESRMGIYANYNLFYKALGKNNQEIKGDPYQVRESLTAISQGGIWGTGSEGGRSKHLFLPDVNSDYIFALIGEQFGFLGGMVIIFLFSILLFRTILISVSASSYFDMMLAMGMGVNIFITAIINIGVSLSALPSTGLTLPFISYGGSALVVNLAMLAIILNISSKRRIKA